MSMDTKNQIPKNDIFQATEKYIYTSFRKLDILYLTQQAWFHKASDITTAVANIWVSLSYHEIKSHYNFTGVSQAVAMILCSTIFLGCLKLF